MTAAKILCNYLQDEATFSALIPSQDFHLGRHWHHLVRNTWESSAILLRFHYVHPLKGYILVTTAITPVHFRSWVILCYKTPKYRSVTEIYSAVFSDAAFANSLHWRVSFHQLVKPSELICKWNKAEMLSDGYKQPEIETSSKFGAKCLLTEHVITPPTNQYPIRSGQRLKFLSHWHFSLFSGGKVFFSCPSIAPQLQSGVY